MALRKRNKLPKEDRAPKLKVRLTRAGRTLDRILDDSYETGLPQYSRDNDLRRGCPK